MRQFWIRCISGMIGISAAGGMLVANQIGLDNNPEWGAKRYFLFFIGLLILAISLFYRENNVLGQVMRTQKGRDYLATSALSGLIILIYIWFISIGLWTSWPNETSYYDLLATAFSRGQLAVEVEPDPALLMMDNVYEPENREGIPTLWDASLYKGKYYLYWGPAPALFLAIIKPFFQQEVGDKVITFLFTAGTFVFLFLMIHHLWNTQFPEVPRWAAVSAILVAGLANPVLYILTEARIYEAAIIAGQCFLMGGMFFLYSAFHRPSHFRLMLAGSFLALAVGSRTTLTLSVAFLVLMTLLWARTHPPKKAFLHLISFSVPLVLAASAYVFYNFARFDSFTEFGLRYQITSYNLHESLNDTFSLAYIPPNIHKTLFNALEVRPTFPYLLISRWSGPDWLEDTPSPFYRLLGEAITGIFISSPFMIFAFLSWSVKKDTLGWIRISLTGSALSAFFMLQIFFFTTMRYLLDLTPTLSVLAVIGFWQGLEQSKTRAARVVFSLLGLMLVLYTVLMGLLLPVIGHLEAYRVFNPDLLEQITYRVNRLVK